MAIPSLLLHLFSLLLLSTTHLSLSSRPNPTRPSISISSSTDVHDLLPEYGLPKGLLPDAVNSYSLSSDGTFIIQLQNPCYVHFDDQLVYYDKQIKGKLSYGSVSGVSGIQAKKLFLWVGVTGMNVDDEDPDWIEFHVGALSQKLPAKEFESVPNCKNKGSHPQSIWGNSWYIVCDIMPDNSTLSELEMRLFKIWPTTFFFP